MIDLAKFEGHTPGPWGIRSYVDAIHIHVADGTLVADVADRDLADVGMPPENARLIAAAPDLLAEVKRLRAVLERLTTASSELTEIICVEYPDLFARGACEELVFSEHAAKEALRS